MQGGIETGVTYHGNYDFRWMDDAMSKKHVGHFTMHSTCTIKKPKNIAIVPNIVAQGYVRGESVTFCRTTEDVKRMLTSPADAPVGRKKTTDVLTFCLSGRYHRQDGSSSNRFAFFTTRHSRKMESNNHITSTRKS